MATTTGVPHFDGVDLKFHPLAEPWTRLEQGGPTIITDGTRYRCIHCGDEHADPNAFPRGHGTHELSLVVRA